MGLLRFAGLVTAARHAETAEALRNAQSRVESISRKLEETRAEVQACRSKLEEAHRQLQQADERSAREAHRLEKLKAESTDPVVQRLLGKTEDTGKLLGLDREWLARAVTQVGNYGEIFERNVGEKTPLALKRGPNALWTQGGLQYAIPIR